MKKTKEILNNQEENVLSSIGNLNFAFCPVSVLKIKPENKDFFKKNFSLIENSSFLNKENLDDIGFFYICYSIAIEQEQESSKDYFYFQTFAQLGFEQFSGLPVFGLFSKEEIVSLIKEVDSIFDPEFHDKQIFGDYQDAVGTCSLILKLMQNWTSLKLIDFTKLYLLNSKFSEKPILKQVKKKNVQKNKRKNLQKTIKKTNNSNKSINSNGRKTNSKRKTG